MALSMRTVIFSLVVLVALLTIPIMIGVYVYRDAKRCGMNAMAWTLIAVVAPALIGFIIYLLVRGNSPDLQCPQCAEPVTEQYVICPHCGAKLRPACPNCSFPVEADWKVCPKCAAPLEGVETPPAPPQRQRDRTLGKILIAIIVVPVALIALAVFGLTAFQSVTGSSTMREVTFDEYDQEQESETIREAVHEWLDSLEVRSDRAYALRYDYSNELGAGQEHYYLFYVPAGGQSPSTSFGTDAGLFGTTLNLRLERTGYNGSLYCVQTSVESTPKPRIVLGGKHIRCEVQVVDYNPTLFFIEPNYAQAEPGAVELPERLSVVKIVGNAVTGGDGSSVAASSNTGVAEITNEDLMLKILSAIDSGERVPMEQIPDYDFKDDFEIVVEYRIQDDLIMHPEMARHLVFMNDGICYLIDDRVTYSAHGSAYRIMDEDFYTLLEELFQ